MSALGLFPTTRVSKFLFDHRARDLSLTPRTAQAATFTRAGTAPVLDLNGNSVTAANNAPRFSGVSTLNNGTRDDIGLQLDSASADRLSYAFNAAVQALTIYQALHYATATSVPFKWEYGSSGYLAVSLTATNVVLTHNNGSSSVTSTATAVNPANGDLLELRLLFALNGSIQLGVSKNSAAEILGTASGALAPQALQASPLIRLADTSLSATFGYALRVTRIAAAAQALSYMQAA